MIVKLILAIFALVVMFGTRSYADDSYPAGSETMIGERTPVQDSRLTPTSNPKSSTDDSYLDRTVRNPLKSAHGAADDVENHDAAVRKEADSMFGDSADK